MAALVVEPNETSVTNAPVAATKATVSSEAPAANARIVVQTIVGSVTSDAAATSGPMTLVLRDGPATTGTVIWACALAASVGGSGLVVLDDCNIAIPTAGNVATLEFLAAGPGTSIQTVSMTYYTTNRLG